MPASSTVLISSADIPRSSISCLSCVTLFDSRALSIWPATIAVIELASNKTNPPATAVIKISPQPFKFDKSSYIVASQAVDLNHPRVFAREFQLLSEGINYQSPTAQKGRN